MLAQLYVVLTKAEIKSRILRLFEIEKEQNGYEYHYELRYNSQI